MKKISVFLIVFTMLATVLLPVYAAETTSTQNTDDTNQTIPVVWAIDETTTTVMSNDESNKLYNDPSGMNYAGINDILPHTTIDEVSEHLYRKGFEVIHLLQKFVQPFAIIIFIIGAFMALIGSLGNGHLAGKGFWGMSISVVIYAVVLYSPLIMQTLVGWVIT